MNFYSNVLCSLTDVAALACGREFLVTSSRELLDTMVQLLGDMKPGLCTKFKVYGDLFFLSNEMHYLTVQITVITAGFPLSHYFLSWRS